MFHLAEHIGGSHASTEWVADDVSGMQQIVKSKTDSPQRRPRLLIVDGHAYAYRAYYAIRELHSPTGEPTNAIYGFIKMLARMREKLAPDYLVVVWDGGLSAERQALLPEYKAQRPEMPESLSAQIDQIVDYLKAEGITSVCEDSVEADDRIAGFAQAAVRQGAQVVIASSDKDFMQLVSSEIGLLNPNDKTEEVWTDKNVLDKTGVCPSQVVDWLSLIGDTVDNISGVPGVGSKTATKLLGQFGSIDALYQRLSEVASDRLRQSLVNAQAAVQRNRSLIQLPDDLAGNFDLANFLPKQASHQLLAQMYARWGFKTLLGQLNARLAVSQTELFTA